MADKGKNPTGANPYMNADGGKAVRILTPCDDNACGWQEGGDSLTMAVSHSSRFCIIGSCLTV